MPNNDIEFKAGMNTASFQSGVRKLQAGFTKVKGATANARKSIKGFTGSVANIQNAAKAFVAFQGLRVATNAIKKLSSASAEFELGITQAAGKMVKEGQKIDEVYTQISDAALKAAGETVFTAKEMAGSLDFLAQAGLSASESVGALLPVAQLASGAGLDLASSADVVTNAMASFKLNVDELSDANNILLGTTTSSNTNLLQLAESIKVAGPVAESLGISMTETSTAIGLLANAGIRGSDSGTGLRKVMTQLVGATGDARRSMNILGVDIETLQSEGFSGFIGKLEEAREKLGANEFSGKIFEAFGDRAGPKLLALVSQGASGIDKLSDSIKRAQKEDLAKTLNEQKLKTFDGAVEILNSNLGTLVITIGTALNNALRPVVVGISEVVKNFNNFNAEGKITNPLMIKIAGTLSLLANQFGATGEGADAGVRSMRVFFKILEFGVDAINSVVVGVRFLSAVIQDLDSSLRQGKFSTDSFDRLAAELYNTQRAYDAATEKAKEFSVVTNDVGPGVPSSISSEGAFSGASGAGGGGQGGSGPGIIGKEIDEVKDLFEEFSNEAFNNFQLSDLKGANLEIEEITQGLEASLIRAEELGKEFGKTDDEVAALKSDLEGIAKDKISIVNENEQKRIKKLREDQAKAAAEANKQVSDFAQKISSIRPEVNLTEFQSDVRSIQDDVNEITDEGRELLVDGVIDQSQYNEFVKDIEAGKELKIQAAIERQTVRDNSDRSKKISSAASALGLDKVSNEIDKATDSTTGLIDSQQALTGVTTFLATSALKVLADIIIDTVSAMQPVIDAMNILKVAISDTLTSSLAVVGDVIAPIIEGLAGIVEALGPVMEALGGAISDIISPIIELISPITDLVGSISSFLAPIIETLGVAIGGVVSIVTSILSPVLSSLAGVFDVLTAVIKPVTDIINTVLGPALQLIGDVVGDLISTVLEPFNAVLDPIVKALEPMLEVVSEIVTALMPLLELFIQFNPVMLKLKVAAEIVGAALNLLAKPVKFVADLLAGLANKLKGVGDFISKPVKKIGKAISDGAKSIGGFFKKALGGGSDDSTSAADRAKAKAKAEADARKRRSQQNRAQGIEDTLSGTGADLSDVDGSDGFDSAERKKLEEEFKKFGASLAKARQLGVDPTGKSLEELKEAISDERQARSDRLREERREAAERAQARRSRANLAASVGVDDSAKKTFDTVAKEIIGAFASGGGNGIFGSGSEGGFFSGFLESLGIAGSKITEIFGDGSIGDIDFSELFSELTGISSSLDGIDGDIKAQLSDVLRSFDAFDDEQIGSLVRRFSEQLEGATEEEKQAFLESLQLEQEQIDALKEQLKDEEAIADSTKKISETLSNIPQGFKVAQARISAIDFEDPAFDNVDAETNLDRSGLLLIDAAGALERAASAFAFNIPNDNISGSSSFNVSGANQLNGGFNIDQITVVANNPSEMRAQIQAESERRSSLVFGNPLSTRSNNNGN